MFTREDYAALVDGIFGAGSATFDIEDAASNNVLGALAHKIQFEQFRNNFAERLRRLRAAAHRDASLGAEILRALNRVATTEWDGAYAELCALDYFLGGQDTGPGKVILDRTTPASETLASEMGMQHANHDIVFTELGVSMDTKLLSDKTGGILEGIFQDFRTMKGIVSLKIIPSYDLGSDFTQYSTKRRALLEELVNGVDVAARPRTLSSTVVPGLSYTFAWKAGAYSASNTYSPTEHARLHHQLLFGHAKKFSRHQPSLITFVVFPWSGEEILTMGGDSKIFFNNFGNHFFNDYILSPERASAYNSRFRTAMSAADATRHLSGVVFLEDRLITAPDPAQLNADASFLWNANALHPLSGHPFDAALRVRGARDIALP